MNKSGADVRSICGLGKTRRSRIISGGTSTAGRYAKSKIALGIGDPLEVACQLGEIEKSSLEVHAT